MGGFFFGFGEQKQQIMDFLSDRLRINKSRVVGCSVVSKSWFCIGWMVEVLISEIRGERS
jgi:hypothetical protein